MVSGSNLELGINLASVSILPISALGLPASGGPKSGIASQIQLPCQEGLCSNGDQRPRRSALVLPSGQFLLYHPAILPNDQRGIRLNRDFPGLFRSSPQSDADFRRSLSRTTLSYLSFITCILYLLIPVFPLSCCRTPVHRQEDVLITLGRRGLGISDGFRENFNLLPERFWGREELFHPAARWCRDLSKA